jgi:hypothetical protein
LETKRWLSPAVGGTRQLDSNDENTTPNSENKTASNYENNVELVGQLLSLNIPELIQCADVIVNEMPYSVKDSRRTIIYLKQLSVILHQLNSHLPELTAVFNGITKMQANDQAEAKQSWQAFLRCADVRPSFLSTGNYFILRDLRSALSEAYSIRLDLLSSLDSSALERLILQSARMTFSTVSGSSKRQMNSICELNKSCIVVIDEGKNHIYHI